MYTQSIDEMCIADVEDFVREGNRESIILDYKAEWPGDLAKVIAAMANTQGGVILIGVAEDGKTGYPGEIRGVDLTPGQDKLRQQVVSTAYKGIYPPVQPEIVVCPLSGESDRAVVVVRVSQSDHAPHAIDSRRRVYVRVDSQTEPHSLAALDSLEWLWHRRQQAELSRDALIAGAKERAAWILQRATDSDQDMPLLRTWMVPHFYSGEEALSLSCAKALIHGRVTHSVVRRWQVSFPRGRTEFRSVPLGYCTYSTDDSDMQYTELGTGGLIYSEMRVREAVPESGEKGISFPLVLGQIDGLIKFAQLVYAQGHVWGLLDIHASLENAQGVKLFAVIDHQFASDQRTRWSPTNTVQLLHEVEERQALDVFRPAIVKKAARSLTWAFGYAWDDKSFDDWFSGMWKA